MEAGEVRQDGASSIQNDSEKCSNMTGGKVCLRSSVFV